MRARYDNLDFKLISCMTTLLDILILLNLGTLSRARDGAVDIRLIFLGSVDIRFDFS